MNALTRFERMDDLFPEFFRRFMPALTQDIEPVGEIRIDVEESDQAYAVRATVPGAKKDDVRVEVDGNRVKISAEVRTEREEKNDKGRVLVRETYSGSATRAFTLAHDIDESGVTAKLEDGVLQLTLPKRKDARSRLVAIQ